MGFAGDDAPAALFLDGSNLGSVGSRHGKTFLCTLLKVHTSAIAGGGMNVWASGWDRDQASSFILHESC